MYTIRKVFYCFSGNATKVCFRRTFLISNHTALVTSGVCVCDDLFKLSGIMLLTVIQFCVYIFVICEQYRAILHNMRAYAFTSFL